MKLQLYFIVLALFGLNIHGAEKAAAKVQEYLKQATASKATEQKPHTHAKPQPTPAVKEQLPSGTALRQLLADPFKPKQDFSHFFDVMEIETVLGGKQMTREEIVATISRKVQVYIGHTHMPQQPAKEWNNTHVPKIIELIFNELPKKTTPVPIPAKPITQPKQNTVPPRNAQPFTAAAADHEEDADDLDDDPFGYDIGN
jgi:hypothetical protein